MNKITQQFGHSLRTFVKDEEGAQVVEYALIIAVVSIALVLALKGLAASGSGNPFSDFITRVSNCLTGTATCTASK
ncbi:Flp family type IVb pilin [Comamonas sp. w2-DMI]|uniref:Flp family type IVb pilin n=1 Tax=Comamonas sp. w2-DMI TaxID=3126391 RepID=UPI0032E43E1E